MQSIKNQPKGFTLIELMIVIVILGILVGTILPRITGGQDRARDLAARANMTSIAQAIELFYNDYGYYPRVGNVANTTYETECLSDGMLAFPTSVSAQIAPYLKGGSLPAASNTTLSCNGTNTSTQNTAFMYYELNTDGTDTTINESYALVSDMLLPVNSNFTAVTVNAISQPTTAGRNAITIASGLAQLTAEAANAEQSVFVIMP